MKRLFTVALLCAIGLSFALPALAGSYRYVDAGPLTWRTYKTGAGSEAPNAKLISGTAWRCDSTTVTLGATNNQGVIDTTVSFMFPGDFVIPAAADSIPCVLLEARLSKALASSGESLYVSVEPTISDGVYPAAASSFAGCFIGNTAAPTNAAKLITGTAWGSVLRIFPQPGATATWVGSETMASTLPVNTLFIPGLSGAAGFRVRLWVDDGGLTGTTTPTLTLYCKYTARAE